MTRLRMVCAMCTCSKNCLLKHGSKENLLKYCPEATHNITHLATVFNLKGSDQHRVPTSQLKSFVADHNN